MKSWIAELALLLVTFIWGATFIFTQIGLQYTTPSAYLLIRFSIALLILLVFFGKNLKSLNRTTVRNGLILGAIFGGGFLLQTFGLKYTTVPKSSFITGIVITVIPFVYWLVERKPIKKWQIVGVIVATIGLITFTRPDFDNINIGDAMTLLSTVFWAFYITYMDVFTRDIESFGDTSQMVVLQYVAAAPMAIIALLLFDSGNIVINWQPALIISLAFNAILASVLVTFIHTALQKYTTPVKAGLIFSLEPVVATFIAVAYTGIPLKGFETIGASILMFGVFVSEFFPYIFKEKRLG